MRATGIVRVALAIACLTVLGSMPTGAHGNRDEGVTVIVHTEKKRILPGERLRVRFEIRNDSSETLRIDPGYSVEVGLLVLSVAEGDGPFRRCNGPMWGGEESDGTRGVDLEPGESVSSETTVLYDRVPSALDPAKELDTPFAFQRPGRYRLKATFAHGLTSIESAPIEVVVRAPEGKDADVWALVGSCKSCAQFLHEGRSSVHVDDEVNAATAESLERALRLHPDSAYAAEIRTALDRHQERLANAHRIDEEMKRRKAEHHP